MKKRHVCLLIMTFLYAVCGQSGNAQGANAMTIASAAFKEGAFIPTRYTADGEDISPPLTWANAPADTQSFALIADDPDAPMGTWVHWVVFNIPAEAKLLPEHVPSVEQLDNGACHGMTSFHRLGYGGPAPPSGVHRYYFKLYALDIMLDLPVGANKKEVLTAMEGHILAEAQVMGKYKSK